MGWYPLHVQVTFDIPDAFATQLIAAGKDPSRATLETLAVEGYRTGRLSEGEVRELLGFDTRMEVHALLAENGVALHFTPEDLAVDAETSEFLLSLRAEERAHPAE